MATPTSGNNPDRKPIRLAVAGAMGRTGREVVALALEDARFELVGALVAAGSDEAGTSITIGKRTVHLADTLTTARSVAGGMTADYDVLIDFTVAAGTMAWLEICRARRIPMVIGSTGHDEAQLEIIRAAAREIPMVKASNFSIGMHTVMELVGPLTAMLGPDYDVEVVETHHRHKVDAPSGTARSLVERIVAASTGRRGARIVNGRAGQVGERTREEIGVHAVRMGEIIGQHEIHFGGAGETVTLRHVSHSRATYAAGALQAAAWLVDRPAGYYSLKDVLNRPTQKGI